MLQKLVLGGTSQTEKSETKVTMVKGDQKKMSNLIYSLLSKSAT